ncbi:MAG: S1 RNA-binding domain-containing protein [Clostridiales bacterium]|nr:S1 RNA-binding domain-containing protein [Clostridiales bacterium]
MNRASSHPLGVENVFIPVFGKLPIADESPVLGSIQNAITFFAVVILFILIEKELLLPFKEQNKRVQQGDKCLVALYIDKSSRLCATMKVYEYLQTDSSYKADDKVTGMVYEISNDFGAFVAVDNKYSGLIATKELYGTVFVGQQITARVTAVKPDGKLDLSIREKAYLQIEKDALKIIEVMEAGGGELPFNDKASPELIKEKVSMSKNEFKRAVGSLLKAGRIVITDTAIKLIK